MGVGVGGGVSSLGEWGGERESEEGEEDEKRGGSVHD